MDERISYEELRHLAMESAYESCRSLLSDNFRPTGPVERIDIFGTFFAETYEAFETDTEELMWRTLELILDRGIGPEEKKSLCSRIINEILSRNSFENLTQDLSQREAEQLKSDLTLLKFLSN